MRLVHLYVRSAALAGLLAAACGCQSAQRPASLLPPGSAPALQAQAHKPVPTQTSEPTTSSIKDSQLELPMAGGPASNPQSDPVGDLIARVEKEYQKGLDNYHAGKTDDAKENFDNALNDLLGSNLDVRSDERLGKEFERIVKGVNDLYPGGTAESDVAQDQQQKAEPAPIDETNGLAPAADAGTKAKAEAEVKNT